MPVTRMPYPSAAAVYEAAAVWRDRCLIQDLSLFGERPGSTLEDAEALIRDFVEQPDPSADKFVPKLRGQLANTPATAVQLAAELEGGCERFGLHRSSAGYVEDRIRNVSRRPEPADRLRRPRQRVTPVCPME